MSKFSNTTDKDGLIQLCEQLCSLGDGGISTDTVLLKRFTNYLNMAQDQATAAIMSVDKNHKYDDYNYGDIPDAPIALVADQRDYSIPVASVGANLATNLRVNGVYFLKSNQRNYLRYMLQSEPLLEASGMPSAYQLHGKSIFFDVPPDADTVSDYTSVHVQFQRAQERFVSTGDDSKEPGFLGLFHPSLAVKASAIYLLPTNPNLSLMYSSGDMKRPAMFENDLYNLISMWGRMAEDAPKTITPHLTPHI